MWKEIFETLLESPFMCIVCACVTIACILITISFIKYCRNMRDPFDLVAYIFLEKRYRQMYDLMKLYQGIKHHRSNAIYRYFVASSNERLPSNSICSDMLLHEPFINHYFTKSKFGFHKEYQQMWDDYATGRYLSYHYESEDCIKAKVPAVILNTPEGYRFILRLVDKGYCNPTSLEWIHDRKQLGAVFAHHLGSMLGIRNYGTAFRFLNISNLTDTFSNAKSSVNFYEYHREFTRTFPEYKEDIS